MIVELRLIQGDQLNPKHSWYKKIDDKVLYVMMEIGSELKPIQQHAQKVIAFFGAMRFFAEALQKKGHKVEYLRIGDRANKHSFSGNLEEAIKRYQPKRVVWQEADSYAVASELDRFGKQTTIDTQVVSSEHFLSEKSDLSVFFEGKKQWRMELWYRGLRKKHNVLMSSDEPIGERWNFDIENRKPWKGAPDTPRDNRPSRDMTELWREIQKSGYKTFGDPQVKSFRWPLTRDESVAQLKYFCSEVLPNFGDFQDAMACDTPFLFHSLLSFSLNSKMLHPREVIDAAVSTLRKDLSNISAVEGFVRQILGWREYVRGIYWATMPNYLDGNFFSHKRDLPGWFWTGDVKMNCMSQAINQSLDHAYAHHIQRLMVIGNFSLLAGVEPKQVHEWYLGVYVDALEWVEVPNTLGMSQFSDGGLLASKPYISSGAYVDRMSNYCKGCHYSRKKKDSDESCPFDTLYWNFLKTHQKALLKNPRMAIAMKNLERKSSDELAKNKKAAAKLLNSLESC